MPVNHYIVTTYAFKANTKLNTEYTFKNIHLLFQETLMFRLQGNGRSFLIISYRNRLPRKLWLPLDHWKCTRPGWMELWAIWCGCPAQGVGMRACFRWQLSPWALLPSSQIPRDILESTARAPSGGEAKPGFHRTTCSVRLMSYTYQIKLILKFVQGFLKTLKSPIGVAIQSVKTWGHHQVRQD